MAKGREPRDIYNNVHNDHDSDMNNGTSYTTKPSPTDMIDQA